MTKKEQTIKAWKELIEKHKKPVGRRFFHTISCPLCTIRQHIFGCNGCPLSNRDGLIGCTDFASYKNLKNLSKTERCEDGTMCFDSDYFCRQINEKLNEAFNKIVESLEKYLPVLEKIPAERFTKEGWTYFEELDRND